MRKVNNNTGEKNKSLKILLGKKVDRNENAKNNPIISQLIALFFIVLILNLGEKKSVKGVHGQQLLLK